MRFYRLHLYSHDLGSLGFVWYTQKREAEAALRKARRDDPENDGSTMEAVNVKPTKAGILSALSTYASHPENG